MARGQRRRSHDQLIERFVGVLLALEIPEERQTAEVGERVAGTGQYGGADIMRIADLAMMEVRVNINENDIVNVKVGDRARIAVDAYPNRKFTGVVKEIAAAATATADVMTGLLGAIAGVSLVVGGIGIMNIMLVSVTERTREIGTRMAVGAHGRDILSQLLIEAISLSSVGGIIGIILGIAAAKILAIVKSWPSLISPASIIVAFLVSAAVGVFFGFYPARKAARLDPIDALRYE